MRQSGKQPFGENKMEPTVNNLQQKFITEITQEISFSTNQLPCFELRFHPDNFSKRNTEIADEIKKKEEMNGGFHEESINKLVSDIVKKLKNKFENQMQLDGISLPTPERGQPDENQSPWRTAYQWLWEKEFTR